MLSFIPKLSNPLKSALRTTEGIFISILGLATAVTTVIDPSKLTHKEAGILLTVQGGILCAQRGLVKAVALLKGLGVDPPAGNAEVASLTTEVESHKTAIDSIQSTLAELPKKNDLDYVLSKLQELGAQLTAGPAITPEEEAAVQPPPTVTTPESAVTPDGPAVTTPEDTPVPAPVGSIAPPVPQG